MPVTRILLSVFLLCAPVMEAQMQMMRVVRRAATGNTHSYAYSFNGTDQALNSAQAFSFSAANTVSVAVWLYEPAWPGGDQLLGESSTNYNSTVGAFLLDPNSGSGIQFAVHKASIALVCQILQPSAATWHHYVFTWDISTSPNTCTAYVDGTSVTTTILGGDTGTDTFSDQTVYLMSRAASSLWNAGSIAEFATWKTVLSSSDAAALWNGGSGALANTVQSGSLIRYWHGCDTSTDVVTGGWTATGTPTRVAGPGLLNCP